ncbi:MAG: lactate utilization protein [Candidatus Competibacter sp.]|nr:lactate utilization protein [Candidatus Competibacter sp.]MDG4585110.1 lactate utilization protein [Candidatus Competibacter sp.]
MSDARANILARLRAATPQDSVATPEIAAPPETELGRADKMDRLKRLMEAMHAEVHLTDSGNWTAVLKDVLRKRSANGLLYGPATPIGITLEETWESDLPPLVGYTEAVEQCKERLFAIDAGITSTQGGLADVGALILWPTPQEPRLMSLAPALHIAVLEAAKIHGSLAEAIRREHWAEGMPTNALLISGPSKTADIELVLTFGVHGPKELIVLILDD